MAYEIKESLLKSIYREFNSDSVAMVGRPAERRIKILGTFMSTALCNAQPDLAEKPELAVAAVENFLENMPAKNLAILTKIHDEATKDEAFEFYISGRTRERTKYLLESKYEMKFREAQPHLGNAEFKEALEEALNGLIQNLFKPVTVQNPEPSVA